MTVHPSLNQARRAARIRRVVEDVMTRRAAGEDLPDSCVMERHADLMPDLARELSVLALLERARASAQARTTDGVVRRLREGLPRSLAPDAFEGYSLGGEVHRGGQGVVYEARQISTGRRVAIKVMREGMFGGEQETARFEREVRILGQLEHPGVVGILASGVHAGHFYYVMDYVSGLPLDRYAAERCRAIRDRIAVLLRVCEAVGAAHVRGIIHRDLKPANILVDDSGQPRILDFGLARVTAEWTATGAGRMTHTGHFVGSMPWASPEQAAGDPGQIDTRTDIYSLGVVLYQVLTGRFPYRVEGGPRDVLDQILTAAPMRPRSIASGIDEDLEAVVLKCLAKERERRYQSAGELAEDLRRYLSDRPVLARPPSAAYQVRSFVRRNRALVLGVAAVSASLVLGLVGTSVGLIEASAGRVRAETARDDAERSEAKVQEQLAESQRLAYVASIAAADSALRADDVATAQARLAAAPPALRSWEWSYLSGQLDQSVLVLDSPRVFHAAVSADGMNLAEVTADGRVRVLDATTLAPTWEVHLPPEVASADDQTVAGISRDGRLIATAHGPLLLVWRIGDSTPVARLGFPDTIWGYTCAAFDPEGKRLIADGRSGRLAAWDLATGAKILDWPDDNRYFGVAWRTLDNSVLVGSSAGSVVLDGKTLERRGLPDGDAHPFAERSGLFRLSPDETRIAFSRGTDVVLRPFSPGESEAVLRGHTQYLSALSFSADGRRLASAGWDRTVRVWNVEPGALERLFIGHTGMINGVGFLGAGDRLVTSSQDGTVRIWDLSRADGLPRVQMNGIVQTLAFSADGATLFAATSKEMRRWSVERGTLTRESRTEISGPGVPGITPDGRTILVPDLDGPILAIDAATTSTRWTAIGHQQLAFRCIGSADGRLVASASADGSLRLWDASNGSELRRFEFGNLSLGPLPPAFSPDSRFIAFPERDQTVIWECATGRECASLRPTGRNGSVNVYSTAYAPAGSEIATGDADGKVTIWDTETFRPRRTLDGMEPGVWSMAFDSMGKRLAAGSQDRTIRIWDAATGQEMLVLRGHTGTIMALAWSPDGRTLASGSYDGEVRLWRTAEPGK